MITLTGGRTIAYEYDAEDRITKVSDSVDGVTTYEYDALGQLVSENGARITYDNFGNILSKNGATYRYETQWRDRLMTFGGRLITYDQNGNPVNYLGTPVTWEKGRQMRSFGDTTYTYNNNGIRTSKSIGCIRYDFILDETKILRQTWPGHELVPVYDNEDSVCGIIHNGTPYYFHKNLQGDVIAIADAQGTVVANYSYDAWGKVLSATGHMIVNINPFRYRSYYYDTDTKLYYLQSRYYDPNVGRVINADDPEILGAIEKTLEANIFAYCMNDPINKDDELGFGTIDAVLRMLGRARNLFEGLLTTWRIGIINQSRQLITDARNIAQGGDNPLLQNQKLSELRTFRNRIRAIQKSRTLKWIKNGIKIAVLVNALVSSLRAGARILRAILDTISAAFIMLIKEGAERLFRMVLTKIPGFGLVARFIGGFLFRIALNRFFNKNRKTRIADRFATRVRQISFSLLGFLGALIGSLVS